MSDTTRNEAAERSDAPELDEQALEQVSGGRSISPTDPIIITTPTYPIPSLPIGPMIDPIELGTPTL